MNSWTWKVEMKEKPPFSHCIHTFTLHYLHNVRCCWGSFILGRWQKPVPPSPAESLWGSRLAHSFFSFPESLATFLYNFLWQMHQLFCRAPASWQSEPWRQRHTNTSASESQTCSIFCSLASALFYPATLALHLRFYC